MTECPNDNAADSSKVVVYLFMLAIVLITDNKTDQKTSDQKPCV